MTVSPAGDVLTWNVAGLLGESVGSSRTYSIAGVVLDLGPDLAQADPVEGSVRVARTNRGVLVSGRLTTSLAGSCSRCLREIEVPLGLSLAEEVLPSIDMISGAPLDASSEPEVARLTDHHELELEPLIREAIQLAEPIAPVCRPDCPGLCPVCGEELVDAAHDHGDEPTDPRLEGLRAFRFDAEAERG